METKPRSFAPWTAATLIAVAFVGTAVLTPLYLLYREIYGFSEITLTLLYAVYVVGNVIALVFLGRLSDQVGRRKMALVAVGVGLVSTAMFLFATNITWLFIGRILNGLAIGVAAGTGTAWLAELYGGQDRSRATLMASAANLAGLAVGAFVAGLLAQYSLWPVRLVFALYLIILAALLPFIVRAPETVQRKRQSLDKVSMRPRLGVPADIRAKFIAPAAGGFGIFALFGFYAALAPSVLAYDLHESNRAVGGEVIFELCAVSIATMLVTRHMRSRTAMICGLVLLLPSLVLLVAAQAMASLPVLLVATAVSGVSISLGYRGTLAVVNEIAPSDRRAEVVSVYLLCCYVGNSIPVIGVGILSTLSTPLVASAAFAIAVALLAALALLMGLRYRAK